MRYALAGTPGATLATPRAGAAVVLGVGAVVWMALFWADLRDAVAVWSSSTAYNHCFLIVPLAAFLAYERRALIRAIEPRAAPLAALLAVPFAASWLVGEQVGVLELRQLSAMALLQVFFLAVLGRRSYLRLAAPLLYLFFLVPVGSFLTPWLQSFTAGFTGVGLNLLGIPNYIDGYVIRIPQGTFLIAEACAGLRFLVASVAFGVFFALTMYRGIWRRVAFVGASLVVPVVANGLRALGIVTLGHVIGSAQAAATDHIVYGWLFFSVVLLILISVGMRYREELRLVAEPAPQRGAAAAAGMGWLGAGALALGLASVGPALAMLAEPGQPVRALPPAHLATCRRSEAESSAAWTNVRSGGVMAAYQCGGGMHVRIVLLPRGTAPDRLLAAVRGVTGEAVAENVQIEPVSGAPGWRLVRTTKPDGMSVVLLLDGQRAVGTGLRSRLHIAAEGLRGTGGVQLAAVVTGRSVEEITAFVRRGDLAAALRRYTQAD